jgi:tetratricopeptide (TPR) repeat protein
MGLFIAGRIVAAGGTPVADLPDFDKLWNYQDPAATEKKFRELLPVAEAADRSYYAQLLTQIARTQGLQDRFKDAHATLDSVEKMLTDDLKLARVRYLLERGRVFNSSGQPAKAMPLFEQSWQLAEAEKFPRYAVDAVHMLAIAAATPKEQIEWNLRAIAMVQNDMSQKGWLNALYNNLGESYGKAGDYAKALDAFEKLAAINDNDLYTMKDQARMLRLLGRVDRAMEIIRPIHERHESEGKRDGWISEEYAECLLAAGRDDEATPHFKIAYALLKDDPWVMKNEPAKLERLRRLTGAP